LCVIVKVASYYYLRSFMFLFHSANYFFGVFNGWSVNMLLFGLKVPLKGMSSHSMDLAVYVRIFDFTDSTQQWSVNVLFCLSDICRRLWESSLKCWRKYRNITTYDDTYFVFTVAVMIVIIISITACTIAHL